MKKRPRECGAGCGTVLRRGHARTAYVLTTDGALHRTLVCPLCGRRGVLTVAHLDEPLRQRPPLRVKPRTASPALVRWLARDDDALPLQSVGTMSREALEAEALPFLQGPIARAEVAALSREALEARVAVQRAQRASSSGDVAAPLCSVCSSTRDLLPGPPVLCVPCKRRREATP